MTGWLIYDQDNIQRNQFFIDRWMAAAKEKAVNLKLVTVQEIAYGFSEGKAFVRNGTSYEDTEFAVMRAQHPLLSAHLEAMGIPCFNNARIADICNNKQKTYSMFADRLPMIDTAFLEQNAFVNPFSFPVVVKAAHGCGGRGVFLANDEHEFCQAISQISPDSIIVQKLCDTPGKDLRVYVLGNKIIAGMQRYSPRDFRSNVGLGGTSMPVALTDDIVGYVEHILSYFHFGLVGIDFIFHQGKPLFNEIEDAVGTRMLYMHTKLDIANDYLNYILESLSL